jgi:hypothetical protein
MHVHVLYFAGQLLSSTAGERALFAFTPSLLQPPSREQKPPQLVKDFFHLSKYSELRAVRILKVVFDPIPENHTATPKSCFV